MRTLFRRRTPFNDSDPGAAPRTIGSGGGSIRGYQRGLAVGNDEDNSSRYPRTPGSAIPSDVSLLRMSDASFSKHEIWNEGYQEMLDEEHHSIKLTDAKYLGRGSV
jgi:hypothetical protein